MGITSASAVASTSGAWSRKGPTVRHTLCALPADATAARCARDVVGARCREWQLDADSIETAQLLVSELVGNAVRHAGRAHELTIDLTPSGLRLGVTDAQDDCALLPAKQSLQSENGRGLWLIDLLAWAWGCEPDGRGGKSVWCQLHASVASVEAFTAAGASASASAA